MKVDWDAKRECPECGGDDLDSNGGNSVSTLTWLCNGCGEQTDEETFAERRARENDEDDDPPGCRLHGVIGCPDCDT